MQKIIRKVDEEKGIHQVTIADERWYTKEVEDPKTGLPVIKAVPSVTWITQSYPKGIGYYRWLAEHGWDEAEAIKIAAGDKGSKVHAALEDIMQGKEVRIDSVYINKSTGKEEELTLEECDCIMSFIAWRNEMLETHDIETLTFEKTIYSEVYNYAGTIDWVVKMTNRETKEVTYWIIDFKTSQNVFPSHELQVNAYKHGVVHCDGENVIDGLDMSTVTPENVKMGILQVGYRKNKAGYKFTEIEDQFDLFLAAQHIWQKEHGTEKPKLKDYPIVISPGITVEDHEQKA